MKKLIFIFLLIGMFACTSQYDAKTTVICPCKVVGVEECYYCNDKSLYKIRAVGTNNQHFQFYSAYEHYHSGDTIK